MKMPAFKLPETDLFDSVGIENPRIKAFYQHWADIRGSRLMPARADIDPMNFPYALGNAFMVDVHHMATGPCFKFRLAGTMMVEVHKKELRGQWLNEVFNDFTPESAVNRDYFDVVENLEPAYYVGQPSVPLTHQDRIERLLLPLGVSESRVDMLLAMVIYYDGKGQESYH